MNTYKSANSRSSAASFYSTKYLKIIPRQYPSTVLRNFKQTALLNVQLPLLKATKVYGQVKEHFHSLLTLAPDGGEWSSTLSDRFTPGTIKQEAG
jgi:hypothetical protein